MNNHIADIEFIIGEFLGKNGKFSWGTGEFDLKKELEKGEAANHNTLESLTGIIYAGVCTTSTATTTATLSIWAASIATTSLYPRGWASTRKTVLTFLCLCPRFFTGCR